MLTFECTYPARNPIGTSLCAVEKSSAFLLPLAAVGTCQLPLKWLLLLSLIRTQSQLAACGCRRRLNVAPMDICKQHSLAAINNSTERWWNFWLLCSIPIHWQLATVPFRMRCSYARITVLTVRCGLRADWLATMSWKKKKTCNLNLKPIHAQLFYGFYSVTQTRVHSFHVG